MKAVLHLIFYCTHLDSGDEHLSPDQKSFYYSVVVTLLFIPLAEIVYFSPLPQTVICDRPNLLLGKRLLVYTNCILA